MLIQRILATIILLPIGLVFIYLGGIWFTILVATLLGIAGWEYANLFEKGGYTPPRGLIVAGVALLVLERYLSSFSTTHISLTIIILLCITYSLRSYEKGNDHAATDFVITLGGIFYIGWLGAYMVSLREIQDGIWWFLLTLPVVWIADTGAYFIGKRYGRHKLSPQLSPKKTWEGYFAGIVSGILGGILLTYLLHVFGATQTPFQGALIGFVIATITPLGDLGESMFKRQFGVKDSSNLIPGHGGAFDRIDSWIWAVTLGYYLIQALYL